MMVTFWAGVQIEESIVDLLELRDPIARGQVRSDIVFNFTQ